MRKYRNYVKPLSFLMMTGLLSVASLQSTDASVDSVSDYYDLVEDGCYVYDEADLLSDSEEEDLQEMIEDAIDEAELNIAVLTIDNNFGRTQSVIADEFQNALLWDYIDNFDHRSGVLLLIDMDDRQMFITTTGIAYVTVNDNIVETILDDIEARASAGQYEEMCQEFVEDVVYFSKTAKDTKAFKDIIKKWNTGNYTDYKYLYRDMTNEIDAIFETEYSYDKGRIVTGDDDKLDRVGDLYENSSRKGFRKETFFTLFRNPLADLGIAVVIALIFVLVKKNPKSAAMTVNAHTYRQGNDLKINRKQDVFLRRTTTKRVIESSSGGGRSGGGSFRSSSGGRSHGGGGRGF